MGVSLLSGPAGAQGIDAGPADGLSFTAYIITIGGASRKPRLDFHNKQMITYS